jgi:ligand-binding sensor domain-containing protein
VYGLYCDTEGFIWARSLHGISKINPKTYEVQNFEYPYLQDIIGSQDNVDIVETKDHLWLGSDNKGIIRIRKNGKLDPFTQWDVLRYGTAVLGLYKDQEDRLYAVSNKGLYKLNHTKTDFVIDPIVESDTLFSLATKLIRFQNTSKLWVSTLGNGILVADINKKRITRKIKSENITDNLISNSVLFFLQDEEKNLFIATGRGVNVYSPYSRLFNIYENAFRKIPDFGHPIYAIYELNNSDLLIGTKHKGLYYFHTSTYKADPIPLPATLNAATKKPVYHVAPFKQGKFLVSSGKGIFGLSVQQNAAVSYSLN